MHCERICFDLLFRARCNYALAIIMDLEHQFFRPRLRISEVALENVTHVGHEVYWVIPDDQDIRNGLLNCLLNAGINFFTRDRVRKSHVNILRVQCQTEPDPVAKV